jgi:osmotically-inducible protein OsmY
MLRKLFAAACCCLAVASPAAAQFTQSNIGGGTSTYGSFGNRTLGGGMNGPSSANFTGNNGAMGNTFGSTAGAAGTTGQQTAGSGLTGSERFLRQNRQGAFVGADSGDAGNLMSQAGQGGMNGMNGMFNPQSMFSQFARMNQQRQNNFNNRNNGRGGKNKELRVAIKADISTTNLAASPTNVSRQFASRLRNLPALENTAAVQVTMEGRTAILTGTVASERDRELVAGLAMLEPGISAVQNNLVVGANPPRLEELPAPRQ